MKKKFTVPEIVWVSAVDDVIMTSDSYPDPYVDDPYDDEWGGEI